MNRVSSCYNQGMVDEYEKALIAEIIIEAEALQEVFKAKNLKPDNPVIKSVDRIVHIANKLVNPVTCSS